MQQKGDVMLMSSSQRGRNTYLALLKLHRTTSGARYAMVPFTLFGCESFTACCRRCEIMPFSVQLRHRLL